MVARHTRGQCLLLNRDGRDCAHRGNTTSTVASLCFAICRRRMESSLRTGASATTVAVCGPSATAFSTMVACSTSTPLTLSENSAPIGASSNARRRCNGSKPGALTPSGIGASPICGRCIACPTPCLCGWRGSFGWGGIPDPFDPRFAMEVDKMAENAAAQFGGDPWLVGYFVDNELAWGRGWSTDPRERYALAISTLNRGPESPAKLAFVTQLIETYRGPNRLAQAWGISLASWDVMRGAGFALPTASLDKPAVISDLASFTRRFAEAYFRTVAEALHRHDPNHLYLGSRFAWRTPEAVEACGLWCDVVSFNLYQRALANGQGEWARFHALGKPALIGEFHFGSTDRGLFWEGLVGAGRESERGPAYSRYLRTVADNPDFVGAHWFQYIDKPLTGRALDGENAHVGFVTVADLPYAGRGTRRQPVGVARATAYCGPRRTITWQWRVGSSRRMLERRTSGPPDIESARL